ncbi:MULTISPECIES: helix-turn-helix domain-containing protein [Micrococcaceae]|uniref:Helix-turn-helix domain-containing protein n=1 Tax=Pseudarthrobacter psychrotolerans TaxID=2697569 RepID=A0A6P1NTV4_9MICC|nr:helix-turn-helix domain-containing protein [Pseudarthrobacter psychrotolerans]QHK22523.1 helix-turn-helix domain-containing protein [Pseudarthrobacter psychrotolerans]
MSQESAQTEGIDWRVRPGALAEPEACDIRLEAVMSALSEPLRLTIVRKLMLESDDFDHPCGWFNLGRPKSTLTHHFRALRDAGLIRQRQYGLERRSRLRTEDLDERFPGLLQLVKNWQGRDIV